MLEKLFLKISDKLIVLPHLTYMRHVLLYYVPVSICPATTTDALASRRLAPVFLLPHPLLRITWYIVRSCYFFNHRVGPGHRAPYQTSGALPRNKESWFYHPQQFFEQKKKGNYTIFKILRRHSLFSYLLIFILTIVIIVKFMHLFLICKIK